MVLFFLCFFPSQKPMLLAQENEKCIIFQELFFFSFSSLDYKGGRLGRRSKGKVGHENTRVAFSNRMFTKFNWVSCCGTSRFQPIGEWSVSIPDEQSTVTKLLLHQHVRSAVGEGSGRSRQLWSSNELTGHLQSASSHLLLTAVTSRYPSMVSTRSDPFPSQSKWTRCYNDCRVAMEILMYSISASLWQPTSTHTHLDFYFI